MSSPSPNRLARTAAKEVPHRKQDRFFAAKSDLKAMCESLVKEVRQSPLHEPMRVDLLNATSRVEREASEIGPDDSGARNTIVELEKQVEHLASAEKWASAAQRVIDRLGTSAPATRDQLLEAQDAVVWHVRADAWDGQLTSAIATLKTVVHEAEVIAARG